MGARMAHERPTDETREMAALYSLGALSAEETRTFEAHLADGCASCAAEVRAFRAAADELAFLADPTEPPRGLRDRLMERLRLARPGAEPPAGPPTDPRTGAPSDAHAGTQVWRRWEADRAAPAWFTMRANEGVWEPTAVPGVFVRRLFVDATRQTVTMVVRMGPGTSYPSHRHATAEECYVIDGDLHVGDIVMRAGDYQRVEAESVHGVQSTDGGCTLLIVSSLHDEIID